MSDVDALLKQQVLHVPQRQRIAGMHQHHEADNLRGGVEVPEWTGNRLVHANRYLRSVCFGSTAWLITEVMHGLDKAGGFTTDVKMETAP